MSADSRHGTPRERGGAVPRLLEHAEDCCGCSVCAAICPQGAIIMIPDVEGFLYPSIDASLCNACGLCVRVCPMKRKG